MKPRHKLFFILPLAILHDKNSFAWIWKTLFLKNMWWRRWNKTYWVYRLKSYHWIWLRKCTCYVSAILKLKHKYQNCSDYVNIHECVNRYLMISKRIKFVFRLILRKHHQFQNKWNKTVVMSCHQRTTTNNNK